MAFYFALILYMITVPWFRIILAQEIKIAIIGAGIGGTSCAYFLREQLGTYADIDIFEDGTVGGRIRDMHYGGRRFEAGGSIINVRNKYMNEFMYHFGFHKVNPPNRPALNGLFDGRNFHPLSYRSAGYSIFNVQQFVINIVNVFSRIYDIQRSGYAFETLTEMFSAIDPNFLNYFNITAARGFSTYAHTDQGLLNSWILASLKVNYGQNLDVPFFVGIVSAVGMITENHAVQGGNKQIPEALLKYSGATLRNRRVTKISYDREWNSYMLTSKDDYGDYEYEMYEYVVIAAPMTEKDRKFEFENMKVPNVTGNYHRTTATFVSGALRNEYFNVPYHQPLGSVYFCDNSCFYSVNSNPQDYYQNPVWKIFSERPLYYPDMNQLFSEYNDQEVLDWYAYPEYDTLSIASRRFKLHDKLYYINAIEWAASAMEMSAIGAKNVALLIKNSIYGQ